MEQSNETQDQTQESTASRLVRMAQEQQVTFFKTPEGEAYANIPVPGGSQTVKVKSAGMKNWLRWQYGKTGGYVVPNKNAIDAACDMLEATAMFEGDTESVHVRLAWRASEQALYLNLGPEAGVVRVTAEGWQVQDTAPVRFRWPTGALPLPRPVRGGKLAELRNFLNLATEDDWMLTVAFLVGMYHPTGPYTTLNLMGEKGCAKTSTSRYLRSLFDPHKAMVVKNPKDAESVMLKAYNNAVVAFDNMSYMAPWLSDLICQINTGAADTKRAHYENTDEIVLSAKHPVILNGIGELAERGDLLERIISVQLPVIPPTRRREETELDTAYEAAQPQLLGALLDVVASALKHRSQVKLPRKPRMADFAVWVTAAEGALGWEPLSFLPVYERNQETGAAAEIEQSPVAQAVLSFMQKRKEQGKGDYQEPAETLYAALQEHMGDTFTHRQGWPRSGSALSRKLSQVAGALRKQGVNVVFDRDGTSRSIILRFVQADDSVEQGGLEGDPDGNDANDGNDGISLNLPISSLQEEKKGERGVREVKVAQMPSIASQASQPEDDDGGIGLDVQPTLTAAHTSCTHPADSRTDFVGGTQYCEACREVLDAQGQPVIPF